ncbi:MAG TPA: SRPBCC family protein, partial [Ilumatobacteraceae bacterium]|nr:SRPBCC family protein [Ilumatobacteraceae bacterium]
EIAMMKRLPVVVAHHSELADNGSFLTRDILGVPLLIVRQSDGSIAAFYNMCRHRGGKVECADAGAKRVFMCQYHGWTFDRDGGTLRNIPFSESFGDIDKECYGLLKVRAEERYGLIWVDFSENADTPIADYVGPEVDAQLASFGLDDSVLFLDEELEVDVNWKLVMDGANDILHLKFLHPNGVGRLITTGTSAFERFGRHGQQFSPRKRMETLAKEGGEVEDIWKYIGSNLRLFPNSMCILSPDHIEFWTVWPDLHSPAKCTIKLRFLVRPEILNDEMAERVTRSWEILKQAALEEDFPMEMTIQANSNAVPDGHFVYGRSELSIQQFHEQLQAEIVGA